MKVEISSVLKDYDFTPTDIEKIIGNKNFMIRKMDFEDGLSGMLVDKVVYVNSNDSIERQRFTLAHEFTHFILHGTKDHHYKPVRFRSNSITSDEIKIEREANVGAALILMPKENVFKQIGDKQSLSESDISELAKTFQVSLTAMNIRLSELGFF